MLDLIDKMNEKVGDFICFGVPVLGFLLLFEVIMRYGFNRPTIWVYDFSNFLFGACYMLGAGYTLLKRGHVNMDMLYSRFPVKGKALADTITGLFMLTFLGVLVWQSGLMAYESILFKEHLLSSVLEPPLYPIKTIFFLGCLLFFLQGLGFFLRDLTTLFTRPDKLTE